jgi:hypothetical protein
LKNAPKPDNKEFMAIPANPAGTALKGALARVADKRCPGAVYRREDIAQFSNAVDRHLR